MQETDKSLTSSNTRHQGELFTGSLLVIVRGRTLYQGMDIHPCRRDVDSVAKKVR